MNQRTKLASALLAFTLVFSLTAWSQEAKPSQPAQATAFSYRQSPERYFRLDFRVLDISPEGKVANSRSYSEIVASGPKSDRVSSIRTRDRVPVVTGTPSVSGSTLNTGVDYFSLETNIDAQDIEIVNQTLRLYITVSISTMSSAAPADPKHPVTRDASWHSQVTVPVHKPAIIFSGDNNADKGKIELELTAVPISQ